MRPDGAIPASTRAIGYVRVSTERQAGEVYTSLADQERAITALAARLGVTVERWYRDEGASGATVAKRPAFRQLIADCEASRRTHAAPGFVLVLNDSRFGRFPDPDEAAAVRFQLKRAGWIVRFAESDDTEDTTGRSLLRALGAAQASEYRKQLQRNARRGKQGTAEQGYWTTRPPFGFARKVVYPAGRERVLGPGVAKAKDEKIILVPDPATAPVVQWAFTEYASGRHTLGTLVTALRRRYPARRWSRTALALLLRNPAYLGHVVGGLRPPVDPVERLTAAPPEQYGKANAHEALVSRALSDAAGARLVANQRERAAQASVPYLLTGLLTCATCGAPYTGGGSSHALRRGARRPFLFYRDTGGLATGARGPICPGAIGTVGKHLIEPVVVEQLAHVIGLPGTRRAIAREVDRLLAGAGDTHAAQRAQLEAERKTLEARRDRLVAAIGDGALSAAEAAPQLAPVRARLVALLDELAALTTVHPLPATAPDVRAAVLDAARDFPRIARAALARGELTRLRGLVTPWLAELTFDKTTRALTVAVRVLPALGPLAAVTSGGERFTVTRSGGSRKPAFTSAAATRSRLSFTALEGRPTTVNCGSPCVASTSTVTS